MPKVSVLIPVYNQVRNLSLVFSGLKNQSMRDFEVVIGDDGSKEEMQQFVKHYESWFPIKYIWHPDDGFRRSKILNEAFKKIESDYCIFMDSDCVPQHHFVHDHYMARETNVVLCGRRVDFGDSISKQLTIKDVENRVHERLTKSLFIDLLKSKTLNWEESIRLPHPKLGRLIHWKPPALLGSNFSLASELFDRVNGFNEDYVGYGLEDSDLAFRLVRAGAILKSLRHMAIQYHLYHEKGTTRSDNEKIFDETIKRNEPTCKNGLRKLV